MSILILFTYNCYFISTNAFTRINYFQNIKTSSVPKTNIQLYSTNRSFWVTPENLAIEVLSSCSPIETINELDLARKPPILFIHGSFHGAWCWEENFLKVI